MVLPRLLLALIVALAGCAEQARPDSPYPGARFTSPRCISHKGCAPPPVAPPRCASDRGPSIPVSALIERRQDLAGSKVRVRGKLDIGTFECTLAACHLAGGCCNKCMAELRLIDPASPKVWIMLRGPLCRGDDSRVCCRFDALERDVEIEGRLLHLTRGEAGWERPTEQLPWFDHVLDVDETTSGTCAVSEGR